MRQKHARSYDGYGETQYPGIFVYGGTIKPGHLKGKDLTVVSVFEGVGHTGLEP
ncbi:MAG: hypothetical protein Ct9H300mP23_09900 [Nitrospinota bacterium]|nr:MAG: hypothetical protein Ct9H300mP23_09900 [Nitrospinota bacterium]